MLSPEMNGKIADVAHWMDLTKVRLGTEDGHAKSAVRAILGLARLTGGDMGRVEEILAEHIAQAWQATGCEQVASTGMTPLLTRAEVPAAAYPAQEMHEVLI
jgi:hypothetical protein